MKPFVIIGLPRSMTAWLANWFTTAKSICYHEGIIHYGELDNLLRYVKFNPDICFGDSSSGIPLTCSDELIKMKDTFNIGYVYRDYSDCLKSFIKVNPDPSVIDMTKVMETVNKSLQNILSNVEFIKIDYDDILKESKFKEFHEALTPSIPFDPTRYKILKDLNITQKVAEVYQREFKKWQQQ